MWMRLLSSFCLIVLAACAPQARVSHFKAMGTLGQNYEQAVAAAIEKSKVALVDANSTRLLDQRAQTSPEEHDSWRAEGTAILERNNQQDIATIAALNRTITQARLFERYFTALAALAAFDGETAVSTSAQETADALGALVPGLAAAKIGGEALPQFVETTTPLVVGVLKSRPLERELRARGPVLLAHLRWQKQLLAFLADRIAADNAMIAGLEAKETFFDPYSDLTKPIDGFKAARRDYILAADSDPTGLRAAAALSDKLRDAIVALADGRLAPTDLADYAQDVSRLVAMVEGIAGHAREATP